MTIFELVNVFFAGMLAGTEFIIHHGVRGPSEALDDHAQLQLRKALVLKLRVLAPAFFLPSFVLGIVLTCLNTNEPGFVLRCVAVAALLLWIIIRGIGTVPINSATLDWKLSAPPKDWKVQVQRAERFHIAGVWASVLAFALFLITLVLRLNG